ncbi:hypothetical protein SMD10_12565 [Consotaella sp. CSK11QG-6]
MSIADRNHVWIPPYGVTPGVAIWRIALVEGFRHYHLSRIRLEPVAALSRLDDRDETLGMIMSAVEIVDALEEHLITEAEAVEQACVESVDELYEVAHRDHDEL